MFNRSTSTGPRRSRTPGKPAAMVLLFAVMCLPAPMPAAAANLQVLRGHVPAPVPHLAPAGAPDPSQHLKLAISLPLRNQPALSGLLRQLYDPANPGYRQFLTPAQFAGRFGPSEKDYQAVIDFAKAHGLKVTAMHSNRVILDVEGTVSDIEKALHVTIRMYQHPREARKFYAPDAEPSLDLAVPILHISGLDNYELPHPLYKRNAAAPNALAQAAPNALAQAAPNADGKAAPNAGSGPGGTYMGNDFRTAYAPGSPLNGAGQTIGLLEFDGYTTGDITYYENLAGLPKATLTNVLLDGFTGAPTGDGGEVEVSLDIEMAISMAQGASNIIVYEAGPEGNWHDILNRMATDNLAKQMSCSWYIFDGVADPVADQIFQQMAAQGQSFFNASGDSDAYTGLIPFPGDTPYVTQVGGTTLTTNGAGGAWSSETVWNWGGGVGSSGGISTQYAIPYYQQGVSMRASQGSTTMRNTPDVALTADNVYVRADGVDQDVGGTSCAAPLWAAFTALINQQAMTKGQPVGFLNPALYLLGENANYSTAFHDIITGNNFSPGSPALFSAVTGYDLCTGWGTPTGGAMINALAGPPDSLQVSYSFFSATGPQGGPFLPNTEAYTLTNTGATSVAWTAGATQSWLTLSATSGTLAVGASTTVIASLNANADELAPASYSDVITFGDTTTGVNQTRPVSLNIPPQIPIMSVTPVGGFLMAGPPGGPFTPTSVTYVVTNSGGVPMSWEVGNSSSWLSVNPAGGTLAVGGTASVTATITVAANSLSTGTYNGTLAFTNLDNGDGNTPVAATLFVWPPPPVITSATTAAASQGLAFSYQIAASNSPASFLASGLPAGLSVDSTTGLISGTPIVSGTTTGTIGATNPGGTGLANLKITVAPEAPVITSASSITGTYAAAFYYQITASNGPASYNATGLPGGLTVNGTTGIISGTPTATGTTNATIYASNPTGSGTAALSVRIVAMPVPVFSVPLTVVCSFNNANGAYPAGGLMQGSDGNFYGTTSGGGTQFDGTIYRMTTSGSLTVMHSFTYQDGESPMGNLVQATDGNFYGTTEYGGSDFGGTVFRMTINGVLSTLYSFTDGTDGGYPYAGLVQGRDGNLYGTSSEGGANYDGTVYKVSLGGSFTALYSLTDSNGYSPESVLLQGSGSDSNLYGTAAYGGANYDGSVFKISPSGSFATLASFNDTNGNQPVAGLATGTDGNFYGTTEYGGSSENGTVFKITPSGSLTSLSSFAGTGTSGGYPEAGLLTGTDGNFYGTTYSGGINNLGTVFRVGTSGVQSTLCTFSGTNGANPEAGLILGSDGYFYGTTYSGGSAGQGTVFKLDPYGAIAVVGTAFSYQITASYNPTSYTATNLPAGLSLNPTTGLISGTPTTSSTKNIILKAINPGGSATYPLIITVVMPVLPSITSLLNVTTPQGQLFSYQIISTGNPTGYQASGLPPGLSLNTTTGLITGVPTASGTSSVLLSATNPTGTGTASLVIAITPTAPVITCAPRTIYSFAATNGSNPAAGVIQGSDGNFYGTTQADGANGDGTVFLVSSTGSYTTLGSLNWAALGAYPQGALLQANNGNFYGAAQSGGGSGEGAVFVINSSGSMGLLNSFNYSNGAEPVAGLVQGTDGNLYGTTELGGSSGQGTVFQMNLSGSITTLCSFSGSNGAEPMAGLVQGTDGNFYGTTLYGGSNNAGTIFKVTTGGSLATLCSFTGTNGANPEAGLIQGVDGNLYGTTLYGGGSNAGTVFKATTSGSLTTLCSFNNANGADPLGALLQGKDGNLYGTTSSGGNSDLGTIFQITPVGSLITLYSFSGANDGSKPRTGLAQGNDGNLYGTTSSGGANGNGTVFAMTPLYVTAVTGEAFSYQIVASNIPTSYNASGLPAGLSVDMIAGLISGTALGPGTASATISASNGGGTGSAPLTINVLPPPPVITTVQGTQVVSDGQPATFSISATGSGTLTYQWYKNGVAISGATGSSYTIPAAEMGDAATYSVTVTDQYGDGSTATYTLTVNDPVPAMSLLALAALALLLFAAAGAFLRVKQ